MSTNEANRGPSEANRGPSEANRGPSGCHSGETVERDCPDPYHGGVPGYAPCHHHPIPGYPRTLVHRPHGTSPSTSTATVVHQASLGYSEGAKTVKMVKNLHHNDTTMDTTTGTTSGTKNSVLLITFLSKPLSNPRGSCQKCHFTKIPEND